MSIQQVLNVTPGTAAGAGAVIASVTPRFSGALRITVAYDVDDTLRVARPGRGAMAFGGGTTLGVNRLNTFVLEVVRGEQLDFSFAGAGNVETLIASLESGETA